MATGLQQKVGFAGRGTVDIVDAQVHLMPGQDAEATLAAMDALGIRSAILDEFWGFDANGRALPHAVLDNGSRRPLSPNALAASLQQPGRYSYLQRIVRDDPQLPMLIAMLAGAPGCRSLRIALLDEDERSRFAAGEWDDALRLAQQHEFPVSVLTQDAGLLLPRAMERFDGLKFVVDHCGWCSTPAQWEDVLRLAPLPGAILKWSHAQRAFRRFPDPEASRQREFLRAIETFGAQRVLWASDVSHEESAATWSELLSFIRDNPGLSEDDRAWVLGRTARRVYRWDA
jgi:L-fuconolactonase